MATMTINNEKNGIELRFDGKPDQATLDILKANGFRWSKYQKMWYAKINDSRMELANNMVGEDNISSSKKVKQNMDRINVWERTRTDSIEHHYENEKLHDTKEIAKRIRTHLRQRFPMCKWSITSDYSSVNVYLKSTPWEKDSDIVSAIMEYAKMYRESYNYDRSDYYSDYFDVNFYGSCNIAWDYEQSEETVAELKMRELFAEKGEEARIAEEIEMQQKLEQMRIEREEAQRRYEEIEKIRKANHEKVMNEVEVKDVDEYFILNLKERSSKCDSVECYFRDYEGDTPEETELLNAWSRCDCKVSREICMTKEVYDLFSNMLLDDWTFLAGKGGYNTDDNRINDHNDYARMSKEEKETVKWYNIDCVAIFVDGELTMVIDPEGFSYARYCFFVDEETISHGTYSIEQAVSDETKNANKQMAAIIEDASVDIIMASGFGETWSTSNKEEYSKLMINWIESREDIIFTEDVVREIDILDLKTAMYDLLDRYNGMQEQFKRAGLVENQKITMFKIGDLGGLNPQHMIFKSYTPTRYAQYDDAVKIVFRPEKKRRDYYTHLYNEVIIFDGYVDIPQDLFWIIEKTPFGVTQRSKYHMHDHRMYDDLLNYFAEKGIKPIINTCK